MAAPTSFALSLMLLLVACFSLVTSTSDPMASPCFNACRDLIEDAEDCEVQNNCNVTTMPDEEFAECTDPCWPLAASCQRICRRTFELTLENCSRSRRCTNSNDEGCVWNCFRNRMRRRKQRLARNRNRRIGSRRGQQVEQLPL